MKAWPTRPSGRSSTGSAAGKNFVSDTTTETSPSLSMVSQVGSDRYSFKIGFDQYDSGKTYYGLDKLCLNNLIQDNTMMKDYLAYRLMASFGVNAPLCSYVYVTVNGEDWGLYLAVEGVEDAFLQRNYGRDHGQLYKPDSMSFGGGRGRHSLPGAGGMLGADPSGRAVGRLPVQAVRRIKTMLLPPAGKSSGGSPQESHKSLAFPLHS